MQKQSFREPNTGDIYLISKREEQVGLYRIAYPFNFKDKKISPCELLLCLYSGYRRPDSNGKQLLVKTYTGIYKYKTKLDDKKNITLAKEAKTMPYITELLKGEALC